MDRPRQGVSLTSRPGSVGVWLAVGILAALAGCGGGGSDRGSGGPPSVAPTPYLQFVHPVSGRAIASGARFDVPDSLRPGMPMRPFILPAALPKPDPDPITPVPVRYVLERQPWPPGLLFDPATRTLRGTLDPTVEHPPSYRLDYRASAPGHLDVHLSIVLYLPPTLRPDGFTTLSFPVGRSTVTVLPAARGGRPPYAYELTGCVVPAWLRREGRSLHGSPTAANQHEPARQCRWRVTDYIGGSAEFEIEVSVGAGPRPRLFFPAADGTPLEDDAPLPPLGTLVQGERLPPLSGFFPLARGAQPGTRVTYKLEVASGPPGVRGLPSGLDFINAERILAGTIDDPRWPAGTYLFNYVASAPGHVDAQRTVSFDLEDPLRLDASSAGPFSFQVGAFTQHMLPQAKGGARPHHYSLEQCPLAWLELVGSELAANPLPEHAGEKRLCRYRVTDATGAFVELRLLVSAVAGDGSALRFDSSPAGPFSFTAGEFMREPLPQAADGAPPYQYTLEQCPLDWLELVGTELTANPAFEHAGQERLCRYRVTDATGTFVELRLLVSAVAGDGSALRFDSSPAGPFSFTTGEFKRQPLPQAAGGAPPYRYSLEQCPLAWLGLVGTEITANPAREHAGEGRLCRYRVTDAVGASVELLVQVSAVADAGSVLRFKEDGTLPEDGMLPFQVGKFERRSLPEAAGGVLPYRYSLEQCRLDWLELVGTELVANPRPEHSGERRLCRYRVTDAEGTFAEKVVEVSPTAVPIEVFQFENRHIVDRDLPVGSEIEEIVLPKAVNAKGADIPKYDLRPMLPPGLKFVEPTEASEGPPKITGTPTAISILTRYCIHATDEYTEEDGSITTTSATPRCFRLRTVGHEVPRFTVNLDASREVFLYSRLISEPTDTNPPTVGTTVPSILTSVSIQMPVAFLPPSWGGAATYSIVPDYAPFGFNPNTRLLTSPENHPLPTPVVYTYGVQREADDVFFAAAICFELGRRTATRGVPPSNPTHVYEDNWLTVTFRDEAVRTSTGEYLCHPNPRGDEEPSGSTAQSNPVHDALGMVHARRAVRLAHGLIGERVRDPSPPGGESVAFHSDVDLARVWGRSGGFSWSGTGESLLAGADLVQPGGALQLGLVAGFHRTALDYRAEARRLEGRYSAGEHFTEILSMHPFAAWRFTTDSVVWGSAGAGAGSLWFEDDAPPFDERRRSGLDLRSAALGFRHPLPWSALGRFSFSGLAEHIALRIEGDEAEHGIRPRSLRGSDLALGLDWRRRPADAEPSLVPSLSLGVRHQSGDGAAGSLIDVGGSIAYRPRAQPLSFDVAASTLLGVAGNDSGSWDVRASARYDPDPGARGLELSLRSVLGAAADDAGAAYGVDGELAYGVFGGAFGSTVRPYVSMSRFAGASGARRAAGLRLRDEPGYRLSLETYEHTGTDSAGLNVRLHRRWP